MVHSSLDAHQIEQSWQSLSSQQFREQEKGSDDEILQFCEINYGVTFPIAKKVSRVITLSDYRPHGETQD